MEIATGLVGLALTALAIILGYIWRTNGRYIRALEEGRRIMMEEHKTMMEGQGEERRIMMEGHKTMMEGQKEIAKSVEEIAKSVERVAQIAQEVHQGQAEMMKMLQRVDDRVSSALS